ncbi:TonB-dependent receptor [Denitratisoma oestradiolicum]|nr:TonB-dependent receptor [Denitratisoma oestradiolicum]
MNFRRRGCWLLLAAAGWGSHAGAEERPISVVMVTATREAQLLREVPAAVTVLDGDGVRDKRPTHPGQVMGDAPGVWVNQTGGEGHVTAIRQPLTTNPVYLYLEDGVPVRSTGFFNHNALYETNVPQSGGIEVVRGPGSALYGSDAIGGVVNVLTRKPPQGPEAEASLDIGPYGWQRLLLGGGSRHGDDAWRGSLNLTRTDGWRAATGYERQAGTARWDRELGGGASLKTVASFSLIDQQTAGSSALVRADYEDKPRSNYAPISYRKVQAFRLSSAYERPLGDALLSVTPYLRYDDMELLANWSLSYDPTVYDTRNHSLGVQLKYRQDFAPLRTRLVLGLDAENSPGRRLENAVSVTASGSGASRRYSAYARGATVYDYQVEYRGLSPYAHLELSPTQRLRLTAGLRYDDIRYDFDNSISGAVLAGGRYYGQAASQSVSFGHWSPKLGATYEISEGMSGYVSASHAFRAPSEGQLFRPSASSSASAAQAAANAALGIKPIKADNLEIGLRGRSSFGLNYELSAYRLEKRDDILSYKDPVTNAATPVNAGRTLHRGIEAALGLVLGGGWRADGALSRAYHQYRSWRIPGAADYSGKEMETAPRLIANLRLGYDQGGRKLDLEWRRLGDYWIDQANTARYEGHSLLNLRGEVAVNSQWSVFGSVLNLTDRRYAESASISSGVGTYSPGMPRVVNLGLQGRW